MKKLLFYLLIFFLNSNCFASWKNKPEIGLGFTNNANYEYTDKDSDAYWWVRSSTIYAQKRYFASLWLSYNDYFEQSSNDNLNWRAGFYLFGKKSGDWDWDVGIGGQVYTSQAPGTTEESFDYTYFDLSSTKVIEKKRNADFMVTPGYQLKIFKNLNDRKDHLFYLNGNASLIMNSYHRISPYAEIGFNFSNDNIYSKYYFELGVNWFWKLATNLNFNLDALYRISFFPNRTVDVETVISKNRKKNSQTVIENQNESYNFTQITGGVTKKYKSFNLKGSCSISSQVSKSGHIDYSEFGAKASIMIPF